MNKSNYKNELKQFYKQSAKKIEIVDIPKMNFLMIDGKGNPNNSIEFSNAVEALYAVAYSIKFSIKRSDMNIDYGVMPLEGLWWVDDMKDFDINNKDEWKWTLMIMQPDIVTRIHINKAIEQVKEKKNPVALSKLMFKSFKEGMSVQTMHIGPFSEEGPTIEKIHTFISDNKKQRRAKHHEIYLTDTRRAKPENWKTIIRQPIN